MDIKKIIQGLNELRTSGNRIDRMYYAAHLREWGKLMKRVYKLAPSKELEQSMLWLHNHIEEFEKNNHLV